MRFSRSLTLLGFGADVSSLGSSPMDFPGSFLLFLGAPAAFLVFFSAIGFDALRTFLNTPPGHSPSCIVQMGTTDYYRETSYPKGDRIMAQYDYDLFTIG